MHFECAASVFLCFSTSPQVSLYTRPCFTLSCQLTSSCPSSWCSACLFLFSVRKVSQRLVSKGLNQRQTREFEGLKRMQIPTLYFTVRDLIYLLPEVCLQKWNLRLHYLKVRLAISLSHLRSVYADLFLSLLLELQFLLRTKRIKAECFILDVHSSTALCCDWKDVLSF